MQINKDSMGIWIIVLFFYLFTPEVRAEYLLNKQELATMVEEVEHLVEQSRYQQAADILEKVLMIDSTTDRVVDIYQKVLKAMDQQIENDASLLLSRSSDEWLSNGSLSVSVGGGNNLNRAPADKNIKISLADGSAILELASDQQPQGGYGVETTANVRVSKTVKELGLVNLAMQIQQRTTDKKNFTDYLRLNSSASVQYALENKAELGVAIFAEALHYDNEARFYSLDFLSRYAVQHTRSCQSQMGLDLQWKHQKDNQLFDSIYAGTAVLARCLWQGSMYAISLNAGNEWVLDNQRPGGGQWQLRGQLTHERETGWLVPEERIKNYINIDMRHDEQGYSTLLNNGAKRTMQRLVIGTEYRLPVFDIKKQWWLVLRSEWQKQYSNIQLFEFESFELWGGVEVQW